LDTLGWQATLGQCPAHDVKVTHPLLLQVGDGTNFVLVLAGALLEQAEELLRMGLSPSEVIEGYQMACKREVKKRCGLVGGCLRRHGPVGEFRKRCGPVGGLERGVAQLEGLERGMAQLKSLERGVFIHFCEVACFMSKFRVSLWGAQGLPLQDCCGEGSTDLYLQHAVWK